MSIPSPIYSSSMDSIHQRLTTAYAGAYAPLIPPPPRRASTTAATSTSNMPNQSDSPPEAGDRERRGSTPSSYNQTLYPVRTRSIGGFLSAGVIFERDPTSPPTDEDIIIVTVRLSRKERRNSYDDPLPDRPPARGFFRRMSTRVLAQPSPDKYKAIKMPRGDYVRYFRHDSQGHYVGTEPEREWVEEEIMEKYGQYQDLPLRSVLGRSTSDAVPLPLGWGS